ncbi:hypothetical protein BZZ01_01450 [Nostocales cyanobacterium HT-58-2]|nr:hypothetical protein BZZ01_01450 [Nostocales cyanobacterium HT-58-2]
MLPSWLLKDNFLWQELFKLFLSLLGSLFLAWLIQIIITRRDRKTQELERKRQQINELRNDLVQVFNEYYKVRKRYTTVRDTLVGKRTRNPYIKNQNAKINEVFDNLLITCIDLEARYSTLIDRLKTTFPDFWEDNLEFLLGSEVISSNASESYSQVIRHKIEHGQDNRQDIGSTTLESFFSVIRHQIEHEQDIDRSIKESLTATFHSVLAAFDLYEKQMSLPKVKAVKFSRSGSTGRHTRKTATKTKAQTNNSNAVDG